MFTGDARPGQTGFGDEQLRVPKCPVLVNLLLDGGRELEGCFYLANDAGLHAGRERVIDLLTGHDEFLPLATDGGPRLLARDRIVLVRVTDPYDAAIEEDDGARTMVPVEVRLASVAAGTPEVRGIVPIAMPPGRARLLDFLNYSGQFFPVLVENGALLVARRYVTEICQPT